VLDAGEVEVPAASPAGDAAEVVGARDVRLPYFVMPYVEGESLRARIVRGPLAVREAVSVLKDAARALAFAHARGVVHRDIKPDNILLAASSAVVTDFGVAKAIDSARVAGRPGTPTRAARGVTITGVGISLGTPAYMAPEQAAADPEVDHRADLYSLGTVAYEMLVGAPPFHGRTRQALLTAQLSEKPPPLAARRYDVPIALVDLIMHCLEKEPADRPKSANEVVRALENPDVVNGPPAVAPAARERRRRRWWTVALPVGLGTLIVAATIARWYSTWSGLTAGPATASAQQQQKQQPAPRADSGGAPTGGAPTGALTAPPPTAVQSVAVLPFTSTSGSARDSGLALGLTAELTNAAARLPGIRVASQTAASTARGQQQPPQQQGRTLAEIGFALGVTMLVEGTVQREGDRVRATVQLVSVRNDSTLWAGRFDGRASNVFAMQDSLTRAVTGAIAAQIGAAPR
jgi:eukaryotic-like serine/threonine-protein kinase